MSARMSAGLLLAALCIIYIPNVGHGYVKDDVRWIADSDFSSTRTFVFGAPSGFYRPLVSFSFAMNRSMCGTDQPVCYGVTNFLLMIACAVAVLTLGRALSLSHGGAVLAAALWAFNWSGVNMAVLWISGRTALLVVLFATAAGAAFAKRQGLISAVLMFFAMLAKEEAVLLPFALLAWWFIDRTQTGSVPRRSVLRFATGCVVFEGWYFYLRFHSGALTPATAPSYYTLSFTVPRFLENAPHYLDRAGTFSVAVAVAFWVFFRPRIDRLTAVRRSQIAFGLCWFVAALGITVFLPVRSSLYACLPSIGIAIVAASLIEPLWLSLRELARRRAVLAGVAASFVLIPLHCARSRPYVRDAELSSRTLQALQKVAADRGAGTVVVLNDDRGHRPSLDGAFGTLIQNAADLVVEPRIVVWIEPPPGNAALAGLRAPHDVDVQLVLRNGVLVPAR